MGCDLNVKSLKQTKKKLKIKYKTVIQICVLYSLFVSVWLVSKKY